jgi:hypothetical protein
VQAYTRQLAPKGDVEVRQKISPMMITRTRNHKMKWQPVVAVCGLGLTVSSTGLFTDGLERSSARGVSRYQKQ